MSPRHVHEGAPDRSVVRLSCGVDASNSRPLRPTLEALVDAREAARLLSISTRKLWELTNRSIIPHLRIGRSIRYDPIDLRSWIDSQKRDAGRALIPTRKRQA